MVAKGPFPAPGCEAVAVFDREDEVRFALDQFQRSGFDRAVLSVLSHMELVEKLRQMRRRRPVANRNHRGNLFLWVRFRDRDHENRAREILARYPARDVHLHGAQRFAATGR